MIFIFLLFTINDLSLRESFLFQGSRSFCNPRLGTGLNKGRAKNLTVRAAGDPSDSLASIAPLHVESPAGQLLAQILQSHPHLLLAAIDQQLENLQNDRDAEREDTSQDLLYK